MSYETLIVERHGRVGWLIFNRPQALNAMNATMMGELEDAWRELDADPAVRVVVNAGEGRAFQTGVDVVQIAKDRDAMRKFSRQTRDATLAFTAWHLGVGKPVIAAVHGLCAGGGLHFVADADIVVATRDAEFFDPHVSVGQVVAYEGITLSRKAPMEPILRMALMGRHERLGAVRAHQLGILSQLVDPPEMLREEAQALAEKVARNSPAAMRATKKALWAALEHGLSDACRDGAQHLAGLWGHPDQDEGPRAFAERREPIWRPT
jgi:enoyl-CoA hydratase/carnithine racemase